MLLVVARDTDLAARRLARRWAHDGARLLTPRDLSRAGWLAGDVSPAASRFTVDGERVDASDLSAVLVRIPSVSPADVPHVGLADRGYCAAEMTAFLAWWLSELPCPVVNRPTPTCLSGTDWAEPTWTIAAAELGVPCHPTGWRSAGGERRPPDDLRRRIPVTVVGDRSVVGSPVVESPVVASRYDSGGCAQLDSWAVRLARAAGVEALTVWFDNDFDNDGAEPCFVGAQPWVDLDDPAIAQLLLGRLLAPQAVSR
jgi:hypothetical protein